jgi:hypothetical protein
MSIPNAIKRKIFKFKTGKKMINAENYVFTIVADKLEELFPNIFVASDSVPIPGTLPAVSLVQIRNVPYWKSMDENTENHADVIYEANVYSNLNTGKKSQCIKIFEVINGILQERGFFRIDFKNIPNFEDRGIHRLLGRWRGIHNDRFVYRS